MKYYESKYTGAEVDALLGKVESGEVGGKVTVDSALSTESENPVQNKVVTEKLIELSDEKADKNGKYADLTAGDLYGHGESAEAEFSFRASGGKSIKDGTAYIKEVHGNSVVWNQLYDRKPLTHSGMTITIDGDTTIINGDAQVQYFPIKMGVRIPEHKILMVAECVSNPDGLSFNVSDLNSNATGIDITQSVTFGYCIYTGTYRAVGNNIGLQRFGDVGTIFNNVKIIVRITDLTKAFPNDWQNINTIEDFYRLLPSNIDINEYNEGEVIPFNADGIKSVGDNAWDEEWESGSIEDNTGNLITTSSRTIRSKNYIKVIGGNEYYFGYFGNAVTWCRVHYYDAEKKWIGSIAKTIDSKSFIPPLNCAYMKFRMGDGYGTTYNHDIMLTLVHSGWKVDTDAGYQPYWADTLLLDNRIKDAFPNGMMPWDKVYNKDGKGYIVKGSGSVDMGQANFSYSQTEELFNFTLTGMMLPSTYAERMSGILCSRYSISNSAATASMPDKTMLRFANGYIYIKDSAYTDVASFKASMAGVILYYELAEPTIEVYDTPFKLDYKVADFGTEEIIGSEPSAPFSGRTIYQFNAVDQIRENYLAIEELKKNGGSGSITIDSALSTSSTNAVQNKVVTSALNGKATTTQHNQLDARVTALEKIHETLDVTVEKLVTEKVDSMDYAPNLSVGTADNLAGVDVVDSDFVFRRSGGGAISDGVARVESIKGNSVVWNQLITGTLAPSGNTTITNNGDVWTITPDGENVFPGIRQGNFIVPKGHKYLVAYETLFEGTLSVGVNMCGQSEEINLTSGGSWISDQRIIEYTTGNNNAIIIFFRNAKSEIKVRNFIVIDLTKMFGAGYEPTTIGEFYARKPMSIEDENAYNEGEIIDMRAEGIKSVGVNQWDEEWEIGNISGSSGANIASDTLLRSKNYIPIMPSIKYYSTIAFGQGVFFYDDKKEFIIRKYNLNSIPQKARYMRFVAPTAYGTIYKNDICINILDTEINGKYFPYTENSEDLSFIKDIFPNGMRSAGTAYDEVYYDKTTNKKFAVQRMKAVKMKDMNVKLSTGSLFYVSLADMKLPTSDAERLTGILSNRYDISASAGTSEMGDKTMLRFQTGTLYIKDLSYTDASSLKASFNDDDMLYYELAEPIVTEITADIVENPDFNLDYLVQNCGTEQMIATEPSSAIKADITYGFNAVGLIKQLRAMIEAMQVQIANLGNN